VESMMTEDNLLIDERNNVVFKNLLIFDQDYDIEGSILIKNTSNYIHYIFAGEFIKEFNISEDVPPDIKKIIVRASSNEYGSIGELRNSFKKSPTYNLIIPLNFSNNMKVEADDNEEISDEIENQDKKKKYLIPIIIAVILIPLIIMILLNNNDETQGVNSQQENPENQTPNEQITPEENQDEDNSSMPETILSFYNEETIKENSEDYAKIDFSTFYDGYYSLKIENTEKENKKYLFAIIDLNDEEYSYLKNREVGISTRYTSDKAIEGNWIIEVRKNGEISNITNEKTSLNPNTWIIKQRSLTLGDNDEIKLFFQYDENSTVWIDSIEIDVLK